MKRCRPFCPSQNTSCSVGGSGAELPDPGGPSLRKGCLPSPPQAQPKAHQSLSQRLGYPTWYVVSQHLARSPLPGCAFSEHFDTGPAGSLWIGSESSGVLPPAPCEVVLWLVTENKMPIYSASETLFSSQSEEIHQYSSLQKSYIWQTTALQNRPESQRPREKGLVSRSGGSCWLCLAPSAGQRDGPKR